MKKSSILITALALIFVHTVTIAQTELTKEEKRKAITHLKNSQAELIKTIKGLSEEQLAFKPNEETWSIAETVEHIAISENSIFSIVEMSLQSDADPSRRGEVKLSDDQVVGIIRDRSNKVKTRPEFEPKNNFGDYKGSVSNFKSKRKSNIKYVQGTKDDLRNRYFEFPFGIVDSYQVVLFLSGHSERHTDQIKELMAHTSFPKS